MNFWRKIIIVCINNIYSIILGGFSIKQRPGLSIVASYVLIRKINFFICNCIVIFSIYN